MRLVVFPEDLNLAAQVVVRTLYQLELTLLLVTLQVLPLYFLTAFVVTLDNLEQASLIMWVQVLVHYD